MFHSKCDGKWLSIFREEEYIKMWCLKDNDPGQPPITVGYLCDPARWPKMYFCVKRHVITFSSGCVDGVTKINKQKKKSSFCHEKYHS